MPKIQADVTSGKLQTENLLPQGYTGERIIRIVPTRKVHPVKHFTAVLSNWVSGGQVLDLAQFEVMYFRALEFLAANPDCKKKTGRLIYQFSKISLDWLKRDPNGVRNYLLQLNKVFDSKLLLTPRTLRSEGWKPLLSVSYVIRIKPGLSNHQFPEVAYIGVGYRDKGHSRIKWIDGSPGWQEVAMSARESIPIQVKVVQMRDKHIDLVTQDSWKQLNLDQLRRSRKMRQQEFSLLF